MVRTRSSFISKAAWNFLNIHGLSFFTPVLNTGYVAELNTASGEIEKKKLRTTFFSVG